MKIDHVQLAIPAGGEAEARAFYGRLLGMEELEKPERLRGRGGCWFRFGTCHVHVGVDPEFRPARKAHPAFVVDGLDELAQQLADDGFEVRWDTEIADVDRLYSADPFGNRLEFIRSGHGLSGI